MKLELKRISLWATIKISFIINLVLGFIVGCFYALMLVAISAMPSAFQNNEFEQFSGVFGAVALLMPFFFAFMMAIVNTILAFIMVVVYNFSARMMGGLELEFAKVDEPGTTLAPIVTVPPVPPPAPPVPNSDTPLRGSSEEQRPTEPPQDYRL